MVRINRRLATVLAALLLTAAMSAAVSLAAQSSPGIVVSDYATGFTPVSSVGPVGLAFNPGGDLVVSYPWSNHLYRFPPGGGVAGAHELPSTGLPNEVAGLAYGADGQLYAAAYGLNEILQVSPDDGHVIRTVATVPCPVGLAVDPASGDLFSSTGYSSSSCPSGAIFRISHPAGPTATVSQYATAPSDADGLVFAPDGTLYAALRDEVIQVSGTASAKPGIVSVIAPVSLGDGIAYAPNPGGTPYLVLTTNDGRLVEVPLDGKGTTSTIVTGGSRGDFATVGPDGCLYADQSDRVLKVSTGASACPFAPPPGAVGSIGTLGAAQTALQCTRRPLVLIDVLDRGTHVVLFGAADRRYIGQRVTIRLLATGQAVGSAVVDANGLFTTTAPLPPRSVRFTNRARYQAAIGSETSLNLKLHRRMYVDSIASAAGRVTITGHVTAPLTTPPSDLVIQRRVSCTRVVDVSRIRARRDGTFSTVVPAPPYLQAAVYRVQTMVRKNRHNPKRFPTFTLPREVALG